MTTQDLVQSYFKCLHAADFAGLRALLHDAIDFQGPIDTFERADDLVEALRKLSKIAKDAKVHKMFVDGDDACVVYDLITDTPIGTSQVAEWFRVRGDKIAAIRVHFDARPFAAMFEAQS